MLEVRVRRGVGHTAAQADGEPGQVDAPDPEREVHVDALVEEVDEMKAVHRGIERRERGRVLASRPGFRRACVDPGPAVDAVDAGASHKPVVPRSATDNVVASEAENPVIAPQPDDHVPTRRPHDRVVPLRADLRWGQPRAPEQLRPRNDRSGRSGGQQHPQAGDGGDE